MLNLNLGQELMQRLDTLGRCSEEGPGLTRRPFTQEHHEALTVIREWMEKAGLDISLDAAGTLIGRKEGPLGSKTLLMGSHQDSIKNGGQYDGMFGIALPIIVLEQLKDKQLPFGVEVLAFADEEGVRFPTALMGPRVLAGTFDMACLELVDKDGIKLKDTLSDFGGDPSALKDCKRSSEDVLGFLEVHIEQGPVLENAGKAVGVVTAICGIERWSVTLTGQAAHAGTTPMTLRRDAFAGAAEIAIMLESNCKKAENIVGVIGNINVFPNVVNAIPGCAEFSIELRAGVDESRTAVAKDVEKAIREIAHRRDLGCKIVKNYSQKAVPCDNDLMQLLNKAVKTIDDSPMHLMSGATHDASAMSDLCPVAMLFTRCTNGLSHHPDEAITADDCYQSIQAMHAFITNFKGINIS